MNARQLIAKVVDKLQDPAVSETEILAILNDGMMVVAAGGDRPYPLPKLAPLPDLLTSDTVTAAVDASSVSMPSTAGNVYHRGVRAVVDAQGYELTDLKGYMKYIQRYPTLEVGGTEHYVVHGNNLYYAPAQAQSLTVHFYRKPVDMVYTSDSEPDGLPVEFHNKVLVAYALRELFDGIEDGVEGAKVNTDYWERRYMNGLTDLERWLGPEEHDAQGYEDSTNYIDI